MARPFGSFRARAQSAVPRRRIFPGDEDWPAGDNIPNRDLPSVPDGERPNDRFLRGFLRKRHGTLADIGPHEQARWAQRFVWCDDFHGRLNYSHRIYGEPSLAMSLQDVTKVRALPAANGEGLCFEVSCPPHRLVLEAPEPELCQKWVTSIERRAAHWRRKAECDGNMTATPIFGAPAGADPAGCWRIKQARRVWF